jgi:tRNA A37 threonylcarbamoyladenosine dehydratase
MVPDQHSRTAMLVGPEGIEKLKSSKVAVFGLGGVGSYCVEALARAGVGALVLVDYDDICLTNINRQLHALHSTVGRPKAEVMRERLLDINPGIRAEVRQVFYEPGRDEELLTPDLDYVVDAIDTVSGKIDLIKQAKARGIPVISCMGAGNKLDPTQFRVADVSRTTVCPLARVMRRELRKAGIETGVKVVYSVEPPLTPLGGSLSCKDGCICPNGDAHCAIRRQIPGSISFVPPVAGLILAGEVIRDLLGCGN